MSIYIVCLVCLIVGGVLGAFMGYYLSELKNRYRWQLKGYFEGWGDAEKLYNKYPRSSEERLEEMRSEQLQRDAAFLRQYFKEKERRKLQMQNENSKV